MKLKNLMALGISLFAFTAVMADDCYSCDPCPSLCDMCDPCEGWSAHIDWLFWKVRRSGLDYAISGEINKGHEECVDPSYQSGVRVGLFKQCDDFDFGVRYTYFNSDETDHVVSANKQNDLFATRVHPAFGEERYSKIQAKYEVELNEVDIEAGYLFATECYDAVVRPFAGIQLTWIDQKMYSKYYRDYEPVHARTLKEELDFSAYGLYMGLEGSMDAFCNIGIFGRFKAGLSVADFSTRTFKQGQKVTVSEEASNGKHIAEVGVKGCDSWLVVPNCEVAAGLQYDLCDFFCADWNIQVGYEFHDWCCLEDFINFDDSQSLGHQARNRANLGFDGLFVRLGAEF